MSGRSGKTDLKLANLLGVAAIWEAGLVAGLVSCFAVMRTNDRAGRPPFPPPAAAEHAGPGLDFPSGAGDIAADGTASPDRPSAAARLPAVISGQASQPRPSAAAMHLILKGLWPVETECGRNLNRGDGGLAAGHLQQHEAHWQRGCKRLGVNWPWPGDTSDLLKCCCVVLANWQLDAPAALAAGDVELLARTFRLPADPWRADNDEYWRRVKGRLERGEARQTAAFNRGRDARVTRIAAGTAALKRPAVTAASGEKR